MSAAEDRTPPRRFNAARYCLAENARLRPDKIALVMVGEGDAVTRLTYAEADRAIRAIAGGLSRLGLESGARVMIRMGNEADYVLVYFGALAAGLVALPSSSQLTPSEAAFLMEDSAASVVVVGRDTVLDRAGDRIVLEAGDIAAMKAGDPVADYADTAADDPATLVYTSGTSGSPKGVLHAHRAIWGRRPMHAHWLGLTEDDVMLHAGAMNWTYTLGVGITDPWACGATAVIYNGPRERGIWAALIAAHGATLFAAVPSVYRQILKYADLARHDLSSLRHGVTAGEALPPDLLEAWTATTKKPLYEALGMSEISTYVSSGPTIPVRAGSPGRPQPGRRIAILAVEGDPEALPQGETGLLAIHRSEPGLMLGYWNRPDEEAAVLRGEWFTGGDLASLDDDGYLWFHGRNDDLMNAMGYRVSPNEVEAVLAGHPAIADVGVTELAVRADVRVIAAFVVRQPGVEPDAGALIAWCAERLAAYKCPREIRFLDALPRTANGKVQRKRLAETQS
ncbi:class I adenylate-forming enzyme family protein [Methylobacterium haplocladii]|uniref:Acetyl-CoA synthetase n=1 Tax=Methylobacterium haplocladii TaxID=1176176 RepID=A0A512IMM0_9HYPH|nr:AMP-binding protein [Methylobacterium haplocladii]GEO98921.1 acetyl-CoA synthetase [Methylobacterium haplocladii]GJD85279.1 Acetyl-coenzyme A synthetase [Methylobacterium haplocladii]GLS58089.1 acetyl-CoA synthetase [Methylobacterium haplocladii]